MTKQTLPRSPSTLSDLDRRMLTPLLDGPQTLTIEGEQLLQDLVSRGYARLSVTRCGPLGLKTGDKMATLTEAGRAILRTAPELCPLQRARSLYAEARQAQDSDMVKIWRGYRWALLADLYLARGDARGVARCVARVDQAGGQP